jgi:hypothetical protein
LRTSSEKPGSTRIRGHSVWSATRLRAAGALLVLALLVAGCAVQAGEPASESSWKSDTDKALGSALSSLGTARLILDNQSHGRLPDRYAAVSLRDATRVLRTETSGYLAAQPPASKAPENAAAVNAIEQSLIVLNQAAVAGSSTSEQRRTAFQAVNAEYQRVEKLQNKLVG